MPFLKITPELCLHAYCLYAGRANGGVTMWDDPIVNEVRWARLEIENVCAGDFDHIYERALEVQKQTSSKLVAVRKRDRYF